MATEPGAQAWRGWRDRATLLLLLTWTLAWAGCGTTTPSPPPGRGSGRVGLAPAQTIPPAPSKVTPTVSSGMWTREADRWMGTPYRLGGNDRRGIDCSGFALQLHRAVAGSRLPRTTADQFRFGRLVARRELRPGDLVFFDTGGRGVSHVGVMVGGDRFAHASTSRGVMYSRLSEDYWNRRYLGARRP